MRIIFTIIIFLLLGFVLCCENNSSMELTKQELVIYQKILGNRPNNPVLIDRHRLGVFGEIENKGLLDILTGLQQDTFDNFVRLNSIPIKFKENIARDFGYPLILKEEIEDKKDLSRIYIFSRVGFSKDGKQAVVMFTDYCEPLCSKGAYYLLTNKNGVWVIEEESESWRS